MTNLVSTINMEAQSLSLLSKIEHGFDKLESLIAPCLSDEVVFLSIKNVEVSRRISLFSTSNKISCEVLFETVDSLFDIVKNPRVINFAEHYISGKIDVTGDLDLVASIVDKQMNDNQITYFERAAYFIYSISTKLTRYNYKAIKGIDHYDMPVEVYQNFLDPYMQYTCGLFYNPDDSIEQAQQNKFEYIAKHTNITSGISHLDIGCGWGGLIKYFTDKYDIHSVGITNSKEQALYAKNLVTKNNAEIELVDFFDYHNHGAFDVISVVGMLEHIPESKQKDFFQHMYSLLKPGGKAYVQCITKSHRWKGGDGTRFLDRYVYAGYHIEYPDVILKKARINKLKLINLSDGKDHYSLTTSLWSAKLLANKDEILECTSEKQYRIYFGYITMAKKIFSDGRGQLTRMVFQRPK